MTTVLLMLGALVVVFGVAALATREGSAMAPAQPDRPDVVLPDGATGADVRAVRFPLALRGYRMRDVDDVLERLAAELDARDERLAALEARPSDAPLAGEQPVALAEPLAPAAADPALASSPDGPAPVPLTKDHGAEGAASRPADPADVSSGR